MNISKKIKSPISEELKSFERQFFNSVSSKITLLDLVLKYVLKRKGKQIRPILVILFSKMFAKGKIPSKTYRAANLVELIHTASLVHDDIVDDSNSLLIVFGRNCKKLGKINKFKQENSLLDQAFIKNPDQKIHEIISGNSILEIMRRKVGE